MPVIDVYAAADLFPKDSDRELARQLTAAIMRAENFGDPPPAPLQEVVGAYIHRMPAGSVHTMGTSHARTVRVQVTLHPGGLDRAGQKAFIAEATKIVAEISGDPTQADRTWVVLVESMLGGWGIAGRAIEQGDAEKARQQIQ